MRVILYAHRLRATAGSGVQRYTDGLLAGMEAGVTEDWDLTAVSPDPVAREQNGRRVVHRSVRVPRKVIHGLWSTIAMPPLETFTGRVDLVHLLSTAIPVPSLAPQVVTVHDLFTVRHPEWFEPRSAGLTLKVLQQATRSARRIIVPSSFVAQDLAETMHVDPQRIAVVPEGVAARFTVEQDSGEETRVLEAYGLRPQSYLVTVGLLSPRKNLAVLARAWMLLRGRSPGEVPNLIVIGPEDVGQETVRRDVNRFGLTASIRFTGFVPDPDLRALVANAAALLHPSLDEGFGLTPLEAMAAGVPALVSNSGAIPEVTGDAAWHLDPHDPAAWADAIRSIQSDAVLRASLIEKGHLRASKFSWAAAARGTLDVYVQALSGG